jgi:hypothetical protein
MGRDDLLRWLRVRPFRPFRIHLLDGTVYEVRHPDQVRVGRHSFEIPCREEDHDLGEEYETVSLLHVTRIRPIL